MPEISFSLISSATLKSLEYLQVAPAEAVLDVSGPMMDPSSLQKFRDAISASFEAHRNNLAALLLKQDALVGKARNEKERDKLIKEFTKQQADAVRRIEKILQEKLDLVREKAAASAKATALKDAQVKV